jgi:hypothetical protein
MFVIIKGGGAERRNGLAKVVMGYVASVRSGSEKFSASSESRLGNTL